jgi:hypothetical protein
MRFEVFTAVPILMIFFGFGSCVDWLVEVNALEKRTASIFRAEVTMLGMEGLYRVAGREVWPFPSGFPS